MVMIEEVLDLIIEARDGGRWGRERDYRKCGGRKEIALKADNVMIDESIGMNDRRDLGVLAIPPSIDISSAGFHGS